MVTVLNPNIKFSDYRGEYTNAVAYPHIAIDNFLDSTIASSAYEEFPNLDSDEWINYTHYNEKKYGNTKIDSFPKTIQKIVRALNSSEFVSELSVLTGIPNLISDPSLEGGGIHQTPKGGFLNMHADFTAHPHQKTWKRRVNLLIYLNKNYRSTWGGDLEIWDRKMENCENKILPIFNRATIFNTDIDTFHGHPDPFNCPEGESRKSIALYYFTEETEPIKVQSTEYRARPNESSAKKVFVWLDKIILRLYDKVKRLTGIDDKVVSKILGWLRK